jgi:hypothetical protein
MKKLVIFGLTVLVGCGGGGSNNTTTPVSKQGVTSTTTTVATSTNNMVSTTVPTVSVPTDVSQISYPSSYQNTVTLVDANAFCDIDSSVVTYPLSWNGPQTLPYVSGNSLNKNLLRSIVVNDITPKTTYTSNTSITTSCPTPDNVTEFSRTVTRLKSLGVDVVQIARYYNAIQNNDGSYTFTPDTKNSLSDSEFASEVNIAHAAGIKVQVTNAILCCVNSNGQNISTPAGNTQNYSYWLNSLQTYMVNQANTMQSLNVDIWQMDCPCLYGDKGDGSTQSIQQFVTAYENIIKSVSSVYTGKKFVVDNSLLDNSAYILSKIDYVMAYANYPYWISNPASTDSNLTVDTVKQDYATAYMVSNWTDLSAKYNKPLIIYGDVQSRNNYLSQPGYMEEYMCENTIGGITFPMGTTSPTGSNTCIELNTTPAFNEQAIIIEAMLETINSATLPTGSIVQIDGYFSDDFMSMNGPTFPAIGRSIRNKPAEGIVKQWFMR